MKIELNKQLDKEVYLAFHNASVGGVNFGEKIKNNHPEITPQNYNEYIDNFYTTHKGELEKIKKETESCLNGIEKTLFIELQKYFKRDYSQENYVCYLSIFDCNPRYLENKTFQVYYKRSLTMRKEVVIHELTHFAFYDFCDRLGIKNDRILWELSEIFNVIFLNLPSVQKVIEVEELLFYPELKEKLEAVKQIWTKNLNAESFIKESLECLEK
jgi:hypothetical protein